MQTRVCGGLELLLVSSTVANAPQRLTCNSPTTTEARALLKALLIHSPWEPLPLIYPAVWCRPSPFRTLSGRAGSADIRDYVSKSQEETKAGSNVGDLRMASFPSSCDNM